MRGWSTHALLVLTLPLVILGGFLLTSHSDARIGVPAVIGTDTTKASAMLHERDLRADISYRPVTSGESGIVLESIPGPGDRVERGSAVHLIASAIARTPEPTPAAPTAKGKAHAKHHERHER
jgi:beta-lactam-binding protein with PASTA domain